MSCHDLGGIGRASRGRPLGFGAIFNGSSSVTAQFQDLYPNPILVNRSTIQMTAMVSDDVAAYYGFTPRVMTWEPGPTNSLSARYGISGTATTVAGNYAATGVPCDVTFDYIITGLDAGKATEGHPNQAPFNHHINTRPTPIKYVFVDATVTGGTAALTFNTPNIVFVVEAEKSYTVTVNFSVVPGHVLNLSSDPPGVIFPHLDGVGADKYYQGETPIITAPPMHPTQVDWSFWRWEDDAGPPIGTNAVTLSMVGPRTLKAVYKSLPIITVNQRSYCFPDDHTLNATAGCFARAVTRGAVISSVSWAMAGHSTQTRLFNSTTINEYADFSVPRPTGSDITSAGIDITMTVTDSSGLSASKSWLAPGVAGPINEHVPHAPGMVFDSPPTVPTEGWWPAIDVIINELAAEPNGRRYSYAITNCNLGNVGCPQAEIVAWHWHFQQRSSSPWEWQSSEADIVVANGQTYYNNHLGPIVTAGGDGNSGTFLINNTGSSMHSVSLTVTDRVGLSTSVGLTGAEPPGVIPAPFTITGIPLTLR